ncbi:MtrB/PioB family outer membrane beta-barrel protein [Ferrimonas sp. SCSIO 43195]|uniref:MtrB/PioB family outer membrane beta-barrel protein n=1 Tax=Ferrimonas sp. SCSIO 43195 TaxID=2822844 RepID=UPI0020758502|nr:MtrB/PioB family outer membrane beta-barrel protein [Ferrimonas sp. SCSIO 43195]USD37720.1 MtrB/PioB family outer membrane beta-barrel protein [Ferrimonas sp. SCSIO 43195]
MKTQLTMVTAALLPLLAQAGDFTVPSHIERDYACNQCRLPQGDNALTLLTEQSTHLDDQYGLSGHLLGQQGQVVADRAGADNGALSAATQMGALALTLDYRNLWSLDDNNIGAERDRIDAAIRYRSDWLSAYVEGNSEDKNGQRVSSRKEGVPSNYLERIDHTTQKINAGIQLNGNAWHLGVSAFESRFEDNAGIDADNRAQQASIQAGLTALGTRLSVGASSGKMIQDEAIVQENNLVPITHFDGEVETLDYNLRLTSRLGSARLSAFYRYSERDNVSGSYPFFDGVNQPIDTEKTRYGAELSYRWSQLALSAGMEQNDRQRTHTEREQTEETEWFGRLDYHNQQLKGHLKLSDSDRSGSQYRIDDNRYRPYYLANRDRLAAEAGLGYAGTVSGLSLTLVWAEDDYEHDAALQHAQERHLNLEGYYLLGQQLTLTAFAGHQQVDSTEQHNTEVEQEYRYAGFGLEMAELTERLDAGLDYHFAYSGSDTLIEQIDPEDDYHYTHRVETYLQHRFSERFSGRLSYTYERYYDTDFANQKVDFINSLADLNQNYIDHKVGVYLSIKL